MTRVFLVDDHEIVRGGVAALINNERDLEVIGEAGSVKQALTRIELTHPDVAVLDVRLPDGSGIDLCREVRSRHPEVACVMLTAYDDDEAARSAVLAGAAAHVLKDIRGQGLIEAIRRVARGEKLISQVAAKQVVERLGERIQRHDDGLSPRERQILDLIADGLSNRQIGERLDLAEKTVKNYVSILLGKLGMERRTQAAVYGAKLRDS